MNKTNYAWWTIPDYEETHWFNEAAEQATIRAIVDGTCHARSWSDIQGTWGWQHPPKPRVVRVEKVKPKWVRPIKLQEQPAMSKAGRQLYKILLANGTPRDEAKRMANELTGVK